jgi:hypothetical protein
MQALLFVYGSLLSCVGHPRGTRLRREASLLGQATIQGRLYSLGRYPGLVEAAEGAYPVHGEVYELKTPARVARCLRGHCAGKARSEPLCAARAAGAAGLGRDARGLGLSLPPEREEPAGAS